MSGDVVYCCQCWIMPGDVVLLPVLDVCLVTLRITASVGCMPGDVVYCCQCWMYVW